MGHEPRVIVAGRELVIQSNASAGSAGKVIDKARTSMQKTNEGGKVEKVLKNLLSNLLHVDRADLDVDIDLKEYGLDSVALTEFADKIFWRIKYRF